MWAAMTFFMQTRFRMVVFVGLYTKVIGWIIDWLERGYNK